MAGHLLLAGGAEFGGGMAAPDRRAIQLAGGAGMPICIIPTAALAKGDRRAGKNGKHWFESLGAKHVQILPLSNRQQADNQQIISELQAARMVYMLGGSPGHLASSLENSLSWQAIAAGYQNGAVIGGSSAGAMVLCEYFYDPEVDQVKSGLGLLKAVCILPHHKTFGHKWAARLIAEIPTMILVGIDERTAIIDDASEGGWQVYGDGQATVYRGSQTRVFHAGERIPSIFWA